MSNSLGSHGLQPTRLLCPWDFPGKNTGVGCYSFPLFLKKKDFLMWTILEVFIEFVIRLFMFYVVFFFPRGMRDLSSSDQGLNPSLLHWKAKVLTTGPPGKLLFHSCLKQFIRKVLQKNPVSPLTLTPTPFPPPPPHRPFLGAVLKEGECHSPESCQSFHSHGQLDDVRSVQFSRSVMSDSL